MMLKKNNNKRFFDLCLQEPMKTVDRFSENVLSIASDSLRTACVGDMWGLSSTGSFWQCSLVSLGSLMFIVKFTS